MYFTGPYLRITTPRTTNGIIPKLQNGQQLSKETFLPLSARKQIEKKNARLVKRGFKHLVSTIEVVGDGPAPTARVRKNKNA